MVWRNEPTGNIIRSYEKFCNIVELVELRFTALRIWIKDWRNIFSMCIKPLSGLDGVMPAEICVLESYTWMNRYTLDLDHRAMAGWVKVRPIQEKTLCEYGLALEYAYSLQLKGFFDMTCAGLSSSDYYLRHEDLKRLTRGRIIWSRRSTTVVLHQSKFGLNQSESVRFKISEAMVKRMGPDRGNGCPSFQVLPGPGKESSPPYISRPFFVEQAQVQNNATLVYKWRSDTQCHDRTSSSPWHKSKRILKEFQRMPGVLRNKKMTYGADGCSRIISDPKRSVRKSKRMFQHARSPRGLG